MKRLLIILVFFTIADLASGAGGLPLSKILWSAPLDGLRARLLVLPPAKRGGAGCRVYIELENISTRTLHVNFSGEDITLNVVDGSNKALERPRNGSFDGFFPNSEPLIVLPGRRIRKRIDTSGFSYTPKDKENVLVGVGPKYIWLVPHRAKRYFLTGSMTVKQGKSVGSLSEWSGTLQFPNAVIP